jgi:hypothetical protein
MRSACHAATGWHEPGPRPCELGASGQDAAAPALAWHVLYAAEEYGYGTQMMTVNDAARVALALPDVTEGERHGTRTWSVAGKGFAWERPFSKSDIKRFGDAAPPEGPILAVRVADLGEKEAVLAAQPGAFFTIPHFDGYPAVLIQLKKASRVALREAIIDGWLACAPTRLVDQYLGR